MYYFNYVDVKSVNHHSSFTSLESRIVHFKNRIGIDDIITKRGKIGMVDYKNHIGVDDIITKRGESRMTYYVL